MRVGLGVARAAPTGFEPPTQSIDSVRILATRADGDKSYAQPGDTVTVEALMVDGRPTKTPPVVLYWIPFICTNPTDDLYYGCFAPLLGGDAGLPRPRTPDRTTAAPSDAGRGGATRGGRPTDAGRRRARSARSSRRGPISRRSCRTAPVHVHRPARTSSRSSHPPVGGAGPYGLVILFNIACAGHVKVVAVDPGAGPQQVPLGCFDDDGNALGPDQYVIGFTREYVYETKTNRNPEVDGILVNGVETKTNVAGVGDPRPGQGRSSRVRHAIMQPPIPLDMDVPQSSWDLLHKSIWVDYYATGGTVGPEARAPLRPLGPAVSDSANPVTYTPPDQPPGRRRSGRSSTTATRG